MSKKEIDYNNVMDKIWESVKDVIKEIEDQSLNLDVEILDELGEIKEIEKEITRKLIREDFGNEDNVNIKKDYKEKLQSIYEIFKNFKEEYEM